jgi:hypothetical protein
MTDAEKPPAQNKLQKSLFIFAYLFILLMYAIIGGLLLGMIFPQIPVIMWIVLAGILGGKLDYRFKGMASRFEQRYVSKMDKK